jgi:hypothetical protein
MVRPPTKKRASIGMTVAAIGFVELILALRMLDNVLFSYMLGSASASMIGLGPALIFSLPRKTIITSLLAGNLMVWLFIAPVSLLSLPPEVLILVLCSFLLVYAVAVSWYGKRKLTKAKTM